jgi:hypothetical protein
MIENYTDLLVDIARARGIVNERIQNAALVKADVERQTLAAAGGYKALGSNEAERGMALEHALAASADYQTTLVSVNTAKLELDILEAQASGLRFAQRERDLALREQERELPLAA